MSFRAETELVELLKSSLISTYRRESIKIYEEISLGYGVADLVVCDLKKPITKNKRSAILLNRSDANIYKIIVKHSGATIDLIADTTRSPKRSILNSIKKLRKLDYVHQVNDMLYINKSYELPFSFSFAIEAKLKNWKRALHQAHRYKWFADYSYVVLDAKYAEPAIENIDLFKRYNVGLSSITNDGVIKRHYRPIRQKPYDPIMQILLSEKIRQGHAFAK